MFHSSVLTHSIGYPEFGNKKIGAAKKNWTKIGAVEKSWQPKKRASTSFWRKISAAKKLAAKKKPLLNGVLLLLPRPKGGGFTALAAS